MRHVAENAGLSADLNQVINRLSLSYLALPMWTTASGEALDAFAWAVRRDFRWRVDFNMVIAPRFTRIERAVHRRLVEVRRRWRCVVLAIRGEIDDDGYRRV